jgi:asparagine synthase (glutamine-hydrolysing)
MRRAATGLLNRVPPASWDHLFARLDPVLPARFRVRDASTKISKLAGVMSSTGIDDMYVRLTSHWNDPSVLVLNASAHSSLLDEPETWPSLPDPVERMMYLDAMTCMPDDMLAKVDRATMGVSLESRAPYLDPRLIEFAWRLPPAMKVHNGQGKWLLRRLLHRYVPSELVERPKMGFGVPIDDWIRGPLRDWAEGLLNECRLRQDGYFEPGLVRSLWLEHLSGRRSWHYQLWDVLMFQAWIEAVQR